MKALIISISITALTFTSVNAQKSHMKIHLNSLFTSEVSEKVFEGSSAVAIVEVDLYKNSLDFVLEQPVLVEEWMTDQNNWNESTAGNTKSQQHIENWMSDFSFITEPEIAIEEWMYSSSDWLQ